LRRLVGEVACGRVHVAAEQQQGRRVAQPLVVGEGGAGDAVAVIAVGDQGQYVPFGVVPVGPGGQAVHVARHHGEGQGIQRVRRWACATPVAGSPLGRPRQACDLGEAQGLGAEAACAASPYE
jgi:hypothetical protein